MIRPPGFYANCSAHLSSGSYHTAVLEATVTTDLPILQRNITNWSPKPLHTSRHMLGIQELTYRYKGALRQTEFMCSLPWALMPLWCQPLRVRVYFNLQQLTSCHTDRLICSPLSSHGDWSQYPQTWMLKALIENGAVFPCSLFICILNLSGWLTVLAICVLCKYCLWNNETKDCVCSVEVFFSQIFLFPAARFLSHGVAFWFAPW